MNERRADVGSKALVAVICLILGMIMTMTWHTAQGNVAKIQANEIKVNVLDEKYENQEKLLAEIRTDVKKLLQKNGIR